MTLHPTPTCTAIIALLRSQGFDLPGPDRNYRIVRTRAKRRQRSEGALSWKLEWVDERRTPVPAQCTDLPGSQWPAKECAMPGARVTDNVILPVSAL